MNRKPDRSSGGTTGRIRSKSVVLLAAVGLFSGLMTAATPPASTSPSQTRGTSAPAPAPDKAYGSKSAPITMEVF